MFLTKKSIVKIVFAGVLYFLFGSISLASGVYFNTQGINKSSLFIIGIVLYLLCPLFVLWGRYAEGTGKFLNRCNKLLREELKPAEFIREYEELKKSPDLVVCKPGVDTLVFVALAYDCLDEREKALAAADAAVSIAKKKLKKRAILIKVSLLFCYGRVDEAEAIYDEAKSTKSDPISLSFIDMIQNTDRAKAIGDYKTVVNYNLRRLEQKFPKLDNLSDVVLRYSLAEAYEKLGDTENAVTYYRYCAERGGETAMKSSAKAALERLR